MKGKGVTGKKGVPTPYNILYWRKHPFSFARLETLHALPEPLFCFVHFLHFCGRRWVISLLMHHMKHFILDGMLREFDTSVIKKVPLSLVIGLFFCQPFCFVI